MQIHDCLATFLVTKCFYPPVLQTFKYDAEFSRKGILFDKVEGNFIKLSAERNAVVGFRATSSPKLESAAPLKDDLKDDAAGVERGAISNVAKTRQVKYERLNPAELQKLYPSSLFEGFSGSGGDPNNRFHAFVTYFDIPALNILAQLRCLHHQGLIGEKGETFAKAVPQIIGHLFAGFNFHFGATIHCCVVSCLEPCFLLPFYSL